MRLASKHGTNVLSVRTLSPNAYKTNDLSTWCRQHCIDVRLRHSVYAECISILQPAKRVCTPLPSQRTADDLATPNANAVSKQNSYLGISSVRTALFPFGEEVMTDGPMKFSSIGCNALRTVCSFVRSFELSLPHSQSHIKNHTLYATAVL